MDKKQIISVMTKKGYHVSMEDRIPMFLLDPSLQTPVQLKKALVEVGYENSFGYKLVGKGSLEKLAVSEDESLGQAEDSFEEELEERLELQAPESMVKETGGDATKEDDIQEMNEQSKPAEAADTNEKEEPEFYDDDMPDDDGESSMWSDSDDFFESADGQMSFF